MSNQEILKVSWWYNRTTKRKDYVAEWQLVYHEIMTIRNYQKTTLLNSEVDSELRMHHDMSMVAVVVVAINLIRRIRKSVITLEDIFTSLS